MDFIPGEISHCSIKLVESKESYFGFFETRESKSEGQHESNVLIASGMEAISLP